MKEKWQARLQRADRGELKRGFNRQFSCLYCETFSQDEVAARRHLEKTHGTPLRALLSLPKSFTGLTDRQKDLLLSWHAGASDAELAAQCGGSTSTLRNQRFALREHARQARLFLAALSLSGIEEEPSMKANDSIDHFFQDGVLLQIPAREKRRYLAMQRISQLFEPERRYSDREVRDLLEPVYPDFAQVRRYLVDQGLVHRTPDNRTYWRDMPTQEEEDTMPIDKKAAKEAYKSTVTPMGVYRILDQQTGRFLLAADRNLNGAQGRFKFLILSGVQPGGPLSDPQMFEDYRDHPDSFTFEVVEQVDTEKYPTYNEAADQLERLMKKQDKLFPQKGRYKTK